VTSQSQDLIGYRYFVHEPLGQGGMGIVYRATDRLTGQTVALKRVHFPTDDGDTSARQDSQLSLANEFQTLSSLRHPYIISVLDYGFDQQQRPYFTMEFLDSALPVTDYVKGKPLREKVRLFSEMLQALTYLHRRGISHRDLKPDNAVVQLDGHLRLLDFGLAGLQNQSLEDVAGTLAYMAPEIFYGQPANPLSDLYAAGVIGYEMFANHHPFMADDPTQLITDILILAPDIASLDIPTNLSNLLERMLRKTPETRPVSTAHILAEMSTFQDMDIPQENVAVRESFLQAARFIGRDKELGAL
jgi:serine/threonine protein kinase